MFCTKCGNQLPDNVKFCTKCGAPVRLPNRPAPVQPQSAPVQPQPTPLQPQPAPLQPQQTPVQPQPAPKGGGSKVGIIIGIIAAVLVIAGFCIWFFFFRGDGGGTTPPAPGPSSSAPAPSSQAAKENTIPKLTDYYKTTLVSQSREATKDYTIDYSGDYDQFVSSQASGGVVSATFDDIDDDGEIEMIVVSWDHNTGDGTGINRIAIYDVVGGSVKRADDGNLFSDKYGGCDYTAQIAYEKMDGKVRFYFTNIATVTTHEGGFLDPTVTVFDYTEGKTTKVYSTMERVGSNTDSASLIAEFANVKEYLPKVYERFAGTVTKDNYTTISGWTREQKDAFPMFGQLDKFESGIKMLAINYFMRNREAGQGIGTIEGVFYGYWETFTGKNTSGMYNGLERMVATPATGITAGSSSEYVIPDSSTRVLTEDDLKNLTKDQLRIARNEIYARHGRKFQDADLQKYFESKSWYKGTIEAKDFNDNDLTEIEMKNRDLIQEYEKKKG